MGLSINLTPFAVGEGIARDADGRSAFVVVVKATYSFASAGRRSNEPVTPTLVAPLAIVEEDRYGGEPASSGLTHATDLGLRKPAVDVWLAGALVFPAPLTEAVVGLAVGGRLMKRARVFGERFWLPGMVHDLVPSAPKPMTRLPLAWELACGGGAGPAEVAASPSGSPPPVRPVDRRNPVGCSWATLPHELQSKPAPRIEDPERPLTSFKTPSPAWGFGPVAPHWEPRATHAGTYDEHWQDERAPLLPEDFRPAFFNAAPDDQRLPSYLPGEEVLLSQMTATGRAHFKLPALSVPVLFVTRDAMEETEAEVDTLIIEPAEERFSLLARAICVPDPNPLAMRQVFVGALTPGRRRALETGKIYAGPDVPPGVEVQA